MAAVGNDIPVYNITIRRGDGEDYPITITDGVGGPAVDLTGARLWYTAKTKFSHADSAAVIRKDNAVLGGVVITGALTGACRLSLLGSDTINVATSERSVELQHDMQIQFSGGQPHTVFSGKLTVEPDVTRTTL